MVGIDTSLGLRRPRRDNENLKHEVSVKEEVSFFEKGSDASMPPRLKQRHLQQKHLLFTSSCDVSGFELGRSQLGTLWFSCTDALVGEGRDGSHGAETEDSKKRSQVVVKTLQFSQLGK